MAAPTIAALSTTLGGRSTSDAELVRAFSAAMAWARKTLGRAADDALTDLTEDNNAAVYGYASDILKLPKAQFGMFPADDLSGIQVAAGDIGRRWAGTLTFGHHAGSSFA